MKASALICACLVLGILVLTFDIHFGEAEAAEYDPGINATVTGYIYPQSWDYMRLHLSDFHTVSRMLLIDTATVDDNVGLYLRRLAQPTIENYDWKITGSTSATADGHFENWLAVNSSFVQAGTYWLGINNFHWSFINYTMDAYVYPDVLLTPNVTRKDTIPKDRWQYYGINYFQNDDAKKQFYYSLEIVVSTQLMVQGKQVGDNLGIFLAKQAYPSSYSYDYMDTDGATINNQANSADYKISFPCTHPSGRYYLGVNTNKVPQVEFFMTLFIIALVIILAMLGAGIFYVARKRKRAAVIVSERLGVRTDGRKKRNANISMDTADVTRSLLGRGLQTVDDTSDLPKAKSVPV